MKTVKELKQNVKLRLKFCWGENCAVSFLVFGGFSIMALLIMLANDFLKMQSYITEMQRYASVLAVTFFSAVLMWIAYTPFSYGIKWYSIQQLKGTNSHAKSIFSCYTSPKRTVQVYKLHAFLMLRKLLAVVPLAILIAICFYMVNKTDSKENYFSSGIIVGCALTMAALACGTYIIFNLKYTAVPYLFTFYPDKSPSELIAESKRVMQGKKEYMKDVLISLAGWLVSCLLVFPIIFVVPYMSMVYTAAIDEIISDYDLKTNGQQKRGEELVLSSNDRTIEFKADSDSEGISCGDFLRRCGVSRRLITKLKRVPFGITRRNELIRTIDEIHNGDVVVLKLCDEDFLEPNEMLRVPIVYEDENMIVFNKPAEMPVHPSLKHQGDTLGNCFAAMYPELTFRPVNRLDKDTSGLCAVAKNAHAANVLSGEIDKIYYAVTEGVPVPRKIENPLIMWSENAFEGYTIDAPIGRTGESIIRREVRGDGQRAVTNYTIIKSNSRHCLVKISLETGRTHQIRVHFSSVGHPLAGDDFYGGSLEFCAKQALHCGCMSFKRVSDGERVMISCPIREDMAALVE